jgi:hypothetical protein
MPQKSSVAGRNVDPPDGADPLAFPTAVRIRATGCRSTVRTVSEGLDMIDKELPDELRRLPRWSFARKLLEEAMRTRRKKDVAAAVRQLRQALTNEKWLVDEP